MTQLWQLTDVSQWQQDDRLFLLTVVILTYMFFYFDSLNPLVLQIVSTTK